MEPSRYAALFVPRLIPRISVSSTTNGGSTAVYIKSMHAFGLPLTREGDPAGDLLDREVLPGAGLRPAWNRAGPPWRGGPIIKRQVVFGRPQGSHERRQPLRSVPPLPGMPVPGAANPIRTISPKRAVPGGVIGRVRAPQVPVRPGLGLKRVAPGRPAGSSVLPIPVRPATA